jgi:prepilin-type N-terminal cleavage/methylation domain-containing protein/prepilin-type processing-associated H-X9-DG protein
MAERPTLTVALAKAQQLENPAATGLLVKTLESDATAVPQAGAATAPGFTVIEMLVVVALLGMLMALLFPVLAQAREQGRKITCLSQLQQIAMAHLLYLQDWDEQLPDWRFPVPRRPEPFRDFVFWPEFLQPWLRSTALLHDPSPAEPLFPGDGTRLADYALCTWGPGGRGTEDSPHFRWAGPPLSLAQVRRPAETILLMDGFTSTFWSRGFEPRHRKGLNVCFLDGHARWLPFGELYRVDTDGQGFYWFHYASADR